MGGRGPSKAPLPQRGRCISHGRPSRPHGRSGMEAPHSETGGNDQPNNKFSLSRKAPYIRRSYQLVVSSPTHSRQPAPGDVTEDPTHPSPWSWPPPRCGWRGPAPAQRSGPAWPSGHHLLPQGCQGFLLRTLHRHRADPQSPARFSQAQTLQHREPQGSRLGGGQLLHQGLQPRLQG